MKSGLERDEFLESEQLVEAATKLAVAAGSYKAEYFALGDAVEHLNWNFLINKSPELSTRSLQDAGAIEDLRGRLSTEESKT
jgi:hypothetical protein